MFTYAFTLWLKRYFLYSLAPSQPSRYEPMRQKVKMRGRDASAFDSQSQFYEVLSASDNFYRGLDIEEDLDKVAEEDKLPVPPIGNPYFDFTNRGEHNSLDTLFYFKELVSGWAPHGRTFVFPANAGTSGTSTADALLCAPNQSGTSAIVAAVVVTSMGTGEFSIEDKGRTVDSLARVLQYQPWREHCYGALTDLHRFVFFCVSLLENGTIFCTESTVDTEADGWRVLPNLCAQSDQVLNFRSVAMIGWAVGATLRVGATAAVVEVTATRPTNAAPIEGVAKIYLEHFTISVFMRTHECDVMTRLASAHVPHIPSVVPNSPEKTAAGLPVLLMQPRGHDATATLHKLSDYLPLLDTLKKMHAIGFSHNDIAPDNILFTSSSVFLADFGSAGEVDAPPQLLASRALFYHVAGGRVETGVVEDLRALVLALFVLTVPQDWGAARMATAEELCRAACARPPWRAALDAAEAGQHTAVRTALVRCC
jgi:hypothetical protein